MRLFVVFVDFQHLGICLSRLLLLADLRIYLSYLKQSLHICWIDLQHFPKVGKCVSSGAFVDKRIRHVEVAFC